MRYTMNKYTYIWSFTLLTLMWSSCYDSIDDSIVLPPMGPDTPILITTAITGSVVDADDNEMSDYQIYAGNLIENVEGKRFLIQLEDINKKGQAIYVKEGNQINSLLYTPLVENDINLIKLEMFDPMNSTLISSSDPNLIDIRPNISLQISIDDISDMEGNIPTEDVYVDHRDLSNLHNLAQLGVSAYSLRNQLRSTQHLNAFHIEVRGNSGEYYKINDKIDINISIDQDDLSLFHFDTEAEQWKEVSTLDKDDNLIQVSTTGLYTISQHTKAVYAEGDVNKEGLKVSYQPLSIGLHALHSTANGKWLTIIPSDNEVSISTLSPCRDLISTYQLPATSIDLVDVDIEVTTDNYYKLQTSVYDCNGDLEENTSIYLKDETGVNTIYTFSDENIDTWVAVCDAEFDIATYDVETDTRGSFIPWSLYIKDDQSFLVSCDAYEDGYSYIKIQDDRRVFPPFDTQKVDGGTTLQSSDENIRFIFDGQEAINYEMEDVNIYLDYPSFGSQGYRIYCENSELGCGFTTWNVTHYEAGSDKWVRVSFAGEIWMQTIDPPQAGYFPVEGVILTKAE